MPPRAWALAGVMIEAVALLGGSRVILGAEQRDGRVLVAGGFSSNSAELFDPESLAWMPLPPMTMDVGRQNHSATLLEDGHAPRRGLNVGGRVYGYDNVEVMEGDRRARVEYRINPAQADVVREIFRRYAAGEGVKTIAKDLNARGVPTPRTGKRGVGAWCSGSIKPMLQRERYRGVIVWGMKEKAYRKGTKVRLDRPECEWVRAAP